MTGRLVPMHIYGLMLAMAFAFLVTSRAFSQTPGEVERLERRAMRGNANAYHDLGMAYKYAKYGMKQDFEKAYRYFCTGADRGSVWCIYAKGYMLYKGLGCKQDYRKAVKCFKSAAARRNSPSMYMLGLCYRNGFGVEKNASKAYEYLERAAAKGYRDAREELGRSNEETYLHEALGGKPDYLYFSDVMSDASAEANDTGIVAGDYHGYLVMYDWSGKFLFGEKPLSMSVSGKGNEIDGFMVIGVDTVPFSAEITDGNRLRFKDGSVILRERYAHRLKVRYRMEDMPFHVSGNKIRGRLNLYSLGAKEPERPMYFELVRDNGTDSGAGGSQHDGVSITPNPFGATFTAAFELQSDADVQVWMFNTHGMMEWQEDIGHLKQGRHSIKLSPDIRPGRYIMNIKAGRQNLHGMIIKGRDG